MPFKRILRIGMRICLGLFAGLILLALLFKLFCVEENWRGRHDLARYEAELRNRGEKVGIASFIPRPVPDEQNFAMAPLLAPIWKATREELSKKPKPPGSPLERLEKVNLVSTPNTGDFEVGRPWDWRAWTGDNDKIQQQPAPDEASAGRAILASLARWSSELQEFSAAADRLYARFPIDYQRGAAIEVSHVTYSYAFARAFWAHANAALAAGDSPLALRDLHTLDRIQSALHSEPMLICYLVRVSTTKMLLQVVWQGCIDHRWNKDQLDAIGAMLAPLNLISDHAQALRGERALSNATYDNFRTSHRTPNSIVREYFSWAGIPNDLHASTFRPASAILCQNQVLGERWVQEFELPTLDASAHRIYPHKQREAVRVLSEAKPTWYNVMAKLTASSFGTVPIRTAVAQTEVDEARVACAIERFRLHNGKLPEALNELVPIFLPAVPCDVIDGLPLRYRREASGNYSLYSIGWNERDDGGTVAKKTGKSSRDNENGDWVWFSFAQK